MTTKIFIEFEIDSDYGASLDDVEQIISDHIQEGTLGKHVRVVAPYSFILRQSIIPLILKAGWTVKNNMWTDCPETWVKDWESRIPDSESKDYDDWFCGEFSKINLGYANNDVFPVEVEA